MKGRDRSTSGAERGGGPNIGAIVLAAGGSTRLGHPKQLLRHSGRTLLRRAADAALEAATGPVVVVLGAQAELLKGELNGLALQIAMNRQWSQGIAGSIHTGLAALDQDKTVDAALVMACDQPHVSADLLRRLIEAYLSGRPPAVACAYAGTLGVPALFDRSLFGELWLLAGDHGAKQVIEKHRSQVARVSFEPGAVDIDTTDDWVRLEHKP